MLDCISLEISSIDGNLKTEHGRGVRVHKRVPKWIIGVPTAVATECVWREVEDDRRVGRERGEETGV